MTDRPHLPHKVPTTEDDISELFRRVEAIEKQLEPKPVRDTGDSRVLFTYAGRLRTGARSTPYEHPTGGELRLIRAKLDVASTHNGVYLRAFKNGDEIHPSSDTGMVMPMNSKVGEWLFDGPWFQPDTDDLILEITEPGEGAKGLTVRVGWQTLKYRPA